MSTVGWAVVGRMDKQVLSSGLIGLVGLILGLSAWNAQAQLNDTGIDQYSNSTCHTAT